MQSLPTHAELIAAIGQRFSFIDAAGRSVDAQLTSAPAGIPMDHTFVCYSATFELPAGVHLPQDIYRIACLMAEPGICSPHRHDPRLMRGRR
ncbi:hypothetical protein LJR230_004806 [Trinickia sp. LjRoot230]|uniref:hypothetical protein n=1 Tax=Trinickia sp. LjRoot230 TaxID=3342288 RepID=UPI003ECD0C1F